MMRIYITNLAKYNEGTLQGEWLEMPATEEELEAALQRVLGEDEEAFITDSEGFPFRVEEYDNITELNEKAERLDALRLSDEEIEALFSALDSYEFDSCMDIIEDGDYILLSDIDTKSDLGEALVHELEMFADVPSEVLDRMAPYLDYEAIGRDATFEGWTIENGYAVLITR